MSDSKNISKKSDAKIWKEKFLHSASKKRAITRRKHHKLLVVVKKQTS